MTAGLGKPVRGSRTGRPIMAVLDLLGRRWTLRILWELRDGPLTFRGLQAKCEEMSSSVLNQRLSELKAARVIEVREEAGYALTDEGRSLCDALGALNSWAKRWAAEPARRKATKKGPRRATSGR